MRTGTGRVSLCVSSQGWLRGRLRLLCDRPDGHRPPTFRRKEILDQVVLAGERMQTEGRTVRNIVFMGMGEPFHNEDTLYEAIAALLAPELFHYPPGRRANFHRWHPRRHDPLRAAVPRRESRAQSPQRAARGSRATDPARRQILARRAARRGGPGQRDPAKLRDDRVSHARRINDSADDARDLIAWLAGLDVHVNLIPYNPIETAPHLRTTQRMRRDAFAAIIKAAGIPTTIRYSLGADIAAACGQLVQSENRDIARQRSTVTSP